MVGRIAVIRRFRDLMIMRRQPRILPIEMSKPLRPRLKSCNLLTRLKFEERSSTTSLSLEQIGRMSHRFLPHVSLLFRGLQSDNEGIRR